MEKWNTISYLFHFFLYSYLHLIQVDIHFIREIRVYLLYYLLFHDKCYFSHVTTTNTLRIKLTFIIIKKKQEEEENGKKNNRTPIVCVCLRILDTLAAELQRRTGALEIVDISYVESITNNRLRDIIRQQINPLDDLIATFKKRKLKCHEHVIRVNNFSTVIQQRYNCRLKKKR